MTEAPALSEPTLEFTVERRTDPLPDEQREAVLANPGFGKPFTDHMVLATWTPDGGWHDARVTAYGPISLDPAAAVLHYAQEIFEGMKAYRHADGSIWTFRPEAERRPVRPLAPAGWPCRSCRRGLHRVARALVERRRGLGARRASDGETSLYLRPFMFASEAFLGVRPASEGHLLRDRLAGRRLLHRRAQAGHASGSRASTPAPAPAARVRPRPAATTPRSLAAQLEATGHGCDQVVFLDAVEHQWVEELGGMNLFFVHARRQHRHPRAHRHHPRGDHPRLDPRARQGARPRRQGAPHLDRRVARGRRLR